MIFAWAFALLLWIIKLPFYFLPEATTFLPLPAFSLTAVSTLGSYTHWVLYLLGPTAGAAFTLDIAYMIPLLIAAYLYNLLKKTGLFGIAIVRGVKI